jgi:hypothetical protein
MKMKTLQIPQSGILVTYLCARFFGIGVLRAADHRDGAIIAVDAAATSAISICSSIRPILGRFSA